jgi:hypothetical protein
MRPPNPLPELDNDMLLAQLDWRTRHCRRWKAALCAAWMDGHDAREPHSAALREICNRFGPTWLDKLRATDLDTAPRQRNVTAVRNSCSIVGEDRVGAVVQQLMKQLHIGQHIHSGATQGTADPVFQPATCSGVGEHLQDAFLNRRHAR